MHQITDVKALPNHRFHVAFKDGTEGTVDGKSLIRQGGVFRQLRDEAVFNAVQVCGDGRWIEWPGEIDLCADALWIKVNRGARTQRKTKRSGSPSSARN